MEEEKNNILEFNNGTLMEILKQLKSINKKLGGLTPLAEETAGCLGLLVEHFVPPEEDDDDAV